MEIKSNRGFTLTELLTVIVIISVFAAVVLYNYRGSNDSLAIDSAVQEVAINIRQAQTYGLSVKESNLSSGIFDYAYGAYFSTSPSLNTSYILFVDKNSNNRYDPGTGCGTGYANTECIERVPFRNSISISSLDICDPATSTCFQPMADSMHVAFRRPNTDASITFTIGAMVNGSGVGIATVGLRSPQGKIRSVTIYQTGQISLNVFTPSVTF